ncbi:MAG TPA: DNA mismatch repair protein MutS [Pricia antarctica]|uniref:DNA mismatch repair protein MutS n=2 Tax=root TaxID=1 RepID=A0A831QND3_9FLAO|nr:DNA mismatch repair protein MutS [Pricia antarctica]
MKPYLNRIEKYETEIVALTKKSNILASLRLFVFVASIIVFIILIRNALFVPVSIFLFFFITAFILLVKRNREIDFARLHTTNLKEINESEILRERRSLEKFDAGQQYIDHDHPYSSDLDIFGAHSLFQLVNRTTTESGNELLGKWLTELPASGEIIERQEMIRDLSQKLDWRQRFQATGLRFINKRSDYKKLMAWTSAPTSILGHRTLYSIAAVTLSVLSLSALVFFVNSMISLNFLTGLLPLALILFVNNKIIKRLRPLTEDIVEIANNDLMTLKGYGALIDLVEKENFESEGLNHLKSKLTVNTYSAGKRIKELFRILEFSQQRVSNNVPIGGNLFYSIFNGFLLLDIHMIIETEKWKSKNRSNLNIWARTINEFEVLNSFAGFYYSNPEFVFPDISDDSDIVELEALGHPLIDADARVCNDYCSRRPTEIALITGSNMAGKTTFLRAVGINLVLAQIGAPCCAVRANVSHMRIFTSMRTQDSLREGVSSFRAELKRMEKLLNLMERNNNVFFLLDEIFKGTNSEDRHIGGFSLIDQIKGLSTSGIIATHDIELAKLAGNAGLVANYSFNSDIKSDEMTFSYRLNPGICKDFNASELMKLSGIKILSNWRNVRPNAH